MSNPEPEDVVDLPNEEQQKPAEVYEGIKTIDEVAKARRHLCRQTAGAILYAMTTTDSSFEFIAERTGRSVDSIRRNFMKLASGEGGTLGFEFLSDTLLAMGCEPRFELKPKEK